jgi:hypothetical protein
MIQNALALTRLTRVALLLTLTATSLAASSIIWSHPDNGLRLGVEMDKPSRTGNLTVHLQNRGKDSLVVFLGMQSTNLHTTFRSN